MTQIFFAIVILLSGIHAFCLQVRITDGTDKSGMEDRRCRRWKDVADGKMAQIIYNSQFTLLFPLFLFTYFRITDATDKSRMRDYRWRRGADDADYFITDITDGTNYFTTVNSRFAFSFSLFFEMPRIRDDTDNTNHKWDNTEGITLMNR